MSHETVTLFFALLAIVLFGFSLLVIGLLVADRGDRLGLLRAVQPAAVELAALVAVTCTLGSLYLSEVIGLVPCQLCWVQRGFMYPAAVLLVVALVVKRRLLVAIGGGLALLGLPVSIFHRYEQEVGGVGDFCDPDNPCSLKLVEHLGFITIPTMAGAGFLGILVLVGLHLFWRTP